MTAALSLMALLFQESGESRFPQLIMDLGADSIERRDAAEKDLLGAPDSILPHLRNARTDPDPERRSRVETLLLARKIDPRLRALSTSDPARQEEALKALLLMEPTSSAILRRRSDALPPSSFLAKQVAAILESTLPGSIGFGILAANPKDPVEGCVPGWEVFINATDRPLILETAGDARVNLLGARGGRGGGSSSSHGKRVLRSTLVKLEPAQAHLKRRQNLLMAVDRNGWWSGPLPPGPGPGTLVPLYHQQDQADGRWTGSLTGPAVTLQFE